MSKDSELPNIESSAFKKLIDSAIKKEQDKFAQKLFGLPNTQNLNPSNSGIGYSGLFNCEAAVFTNGNATSWPKVNLDELIHTIKEFKQEEAEANEAVVNCLGKSFLIDQVQLIDYKTAFDAMQFYTPVALGMPWRPWDLPTETVVLGDVSVTTCIQASLGFAYHDMRLDRIESRTR